MARREAPAADGAAANCDDLLDDALTTGQPIARAGRGRPRGALPSPEEPAPRAGAQHEWGSYEACTRDELYRMAAERGIEGRSCMSKAELIAALRADR